MNFQEPNISEIRKEFSDYSEINFYKKGGFKVVYKARIKDNYEALKLVYIPNPNEVNLDIEEIESAKKRVFREINLLNNCISKNIVKLGNLKPVEKNIDTKNFIAYSEEFIEGENLFELIKKNYEPDENEIRILVISILVAINELWDKSKSVHRDIKPLNIIKTNQSERPFVLFDLGIAFSINETPLTVNPQGKFPIGTTLYLAPEMFDSNFRNSIDFRTDLYALGVTAYEYASRKNPFFKGIENPLLTFTRILREVPQKLKTLRPDLSDMLCELIDQWIKKKPHLRPSNIKRIINNLKN
ncbi:MAG: serine/threonine-protein kinase [Ignavibacteria bacterium]|jgi:serine/threonine protein kinase